MNGRLFEAIIVRLIVSITLVLSLSPLLLHPTFSIGYAHRFHYLGSYLARVNIDLRPKCICDEEVEFIGISLLIQPALNILHLRPSSSSSSPKRKLRGHSEVLELLRNFS
jgi:hypothetical protein